jgi:protein gp37
MAENSRIVWTTHTFNPVVGCTKVSPACDNCYAEGWAKRTGSPELWNGERRRTKTWGEPVKWNKRSAEKGIRDRVFCASLADVFDNQWEKQWRDDLWQLIRETPNLDWLLLTKRPQNIVKYLPQDWGFGYHNVWLGATVENQIEAERRIPPLLQVPAKVHRGLMDWCPTHYFDGGFCVGPCPDAVRLKWVITGGESGPNFRHADPDWFRSLRDQCADAGIPFLFKQWEGPTQPIIKAKGRELDGVVHDEYPK